MARQPRSKRDIGFDAISVVGGLISPDKIAQIAAFSPDAKTTESYACPKGTNLRDEIARYFRIGQAEWQGFSVAESPEFDQCTVFTKALLEGTFGYQNLQGPRFHQQDGHNYNIALEGKNGRIPIVVAPPPSNRDDDAFKIAYKEFGDSGGSRSKRHPDALLQEWLNSSESAHWGLVIAGDRLRLQRDNASFTRPAYIEADLGAIFRDEMFADFTLLWLLIHETRFGNEGASLSDSALERWREEGLESGTTARERLQGNVQEALLSLGQGILEDNPNIKEKLDSGVLADQHWFEQLLRIVYRLIFVAVTEERELLHKPETTLDVKTLYANGYSFAYMRKRSKRPTLRNLCGDVWQGARILFRALDKGQSKLGLPSLGGIFDENLTPDLNETKIANKHFLNAIYRLSFLHDEGARVRINWRDMATEELGSVYEGLLELVPARANHGRDFVFASGNETRGNARKTSGSYYTPDSLVQAVLDSALNPLLHRAEVDGGVDAILDLTVIDPACGSAHFLLGAARRMAERIAKLRNSENPDFQKALRDVVRRCIYGVDRNPMAVELAKVALWIETVEPGKPLGFLDANLRCGDSLLGIFDLESLRQGIPDAAYKKLPGDEKQISRHIAKKNKAEREGQGSLGFSRGGGSLPPSPPIGEAALELRAMPENTPKQIQSKVQAFEKLEVRSERVKWETASDLYVAAFLKPRKRQTLLDSVPTSGDIWRLLSNGKTSKELVHLAKEIKEQVHAFHWPLEFPEIMAKGGFDLVIGNPPWEVIQLSNAEYFSHLRPDIAVLAGVSQKKAIESLAEEDPRLYEDYLFAKRLILSATLFVRESGRFPRCAKGKINTFGLFAELFTSVTSSSGRAGAVLPSEILTSETMFDFISYLFKDGRILSSYNFENENFIFPGIANVVRFALLTFGGKSSNAGPVRVANYLRHPLAMNEDERIVELDAHDINIFTGSLGTVPIFRSKADRNLYEKLVSLKSRLETSKSQSVGNWRVTARQGLFNMNTSSIHFRAASALEQNGFLMEANRLFTSSHQTYVPLYEGKFISHFDHRSSSFHNLGKVKGRGGRGLPPMDISDYQNSEFEVLPRYWVEKSRVESKLLEVNWERDWLFVWRDVANAKVERTMTFAITPRYALGHSCSVLFPDGDARSCAALLANLNSLVADYCARQIVGGSHVTYGYLQQIPLIAPNLLDDARISFITNRTLELSYTSQSLKGFANDLGYAGEPFGWDIKRRAHLRAELDAFFARAYGLTRDELRYLLDPSLIFGADYPSETFRVLKEKEIREYQEYRTAELVLSAWDQFEGNGTFKELGLMP